MSSDGEKEKVQPSGSQSIVTSESQSEVSLKEPLVFCPVSECVKEVDSGSLYYHVCEAIFLRMMFKIHIRCM